MENERIRIADIASELGLSTATVSNVIHGKTKKISDETVKRVQELVEVRGVDRHHRNMGLWRAVRTACRVCAAA